MKKLSVLLGCECSGTVRDAFIKRGHDAWSCDLKDDTSGTFPAFHIRGDLREVITSRYWDLAICHPPCTYLTVSANKWFTNEHLEREPWRSMARREAIEFVDFLWNIPRENVGKLCLENPKGVLARYIGPHTQMINPYYFGDSAQKETYLWLRGLHKLHHAKVPDLFTDKTHVDPGEFKVWTTKDGRTKRCPMWFYKSKVSNQELTATTRSKTFPGIARAMAEQWG